jgi:hypothetical protein
MSDFNVGDSVIISRRVEESGDKSCVWHDKGLMDNLIGRIGVIRDWNTAEDRWLVEFSDGMDWWFLPECFESPPDISSLYTTGPDNTVYVGETYIQRAKRKKDGEAQYIIQYSDTKGRSACVKKKDLLALAAALIDLAGEEK